MSNEINENELNNSNEELNLDTNLSVNEEVSNDTSTVLPSSKPIKVKKRNKIPQNLAERFDTDLSLGLTNEQVELRNKSALNNVSQNKNSKSIFSIIVGNTCTFFNLLGLLVFIAYSLVGASLSNYIFIFFFATNLVIGIIQEIRAKVSIEKLSLLQAPTTIVLRDGVEQEIHSTDLVLDDLFKLSIGNQIPVDGIVKQGYIEVNESLLTGESVAIKKNVGDKIMAGSFVTSGSCFAIADKVGDECYVQKLTQKAKKFKKPHSELMSTLGWIVKIVGILIVPISIGIGFVNYKTATTSPDIPTSLFVVTRTGSVIVGMIPSGLVLLTTIALCLGVLRLHKQNTLVQDMYSLEMLARVDVLCLDKTGTITDGRMKVIKDIMLSQHHPRELNDIIGVMENILDDNNQTAIALRANYITDKDYTAIKTIPFSSKTKYSAVTFKDIGTYALGAPEFILQEIPDEIKNQIEQYTRMGHRVLLLAYSTAQITSKEELPLSMKPVALIILSDNIREDAIETINWFKQNEVQVKVISGDNPITVSEVAKRAGIENASNWISLEGLSDKEVASVANSYTVFGRVTPDQKAVLVKALKLAGHTVAMTGDGVNDILAMREADCSVTVASGADSAKNIAHIILADNNFNSMPKVVAEGRRVINNIQQSASLYLMKTLFITLLALISIATVKPFPFESGMLTILEFAVIGFPSIILSLQQNTKRVEGEFLSTIISNAIPGSIILLLNLYIVKLLSLIGIFADLSDNFVLTLQVVSFTLGGAVYLYKVCRPFNLARAILMFVVGAIIAVWMILLLDTTYFLGTNFFGLSQIFPITKSNWQYFLLLIAIIELDIPLVDALMSFNKNISNANKRKKR